MKRLYIIIIIIAQCAGLVSLSRAAAASERPGTPLRIGYLVDGSDFVPADDPFSGDALGQRLRASILANKNLVAAMQRAGFAGVDLTPVSSSGEMYQLMRSGDLHLVLCTAYIYGRFRQFAAETPPRYDYEPILQSRRSGDIDQGRGNGVLRRGVVIIGPSSPYFSRDPLPRAEVAKSIAASPLAVPSIDSAAGYLFSLVTLSTKYGVSRPGQFWYCGSDADVVAQVVSGLAPYGACREAALKSTLAAATQTAQTSETIIRYCRVFIQTDTFPTDPILIRADLLPSRTDIGRELKPVLREFFNTQTLDRDLRVEDAVPRAYESIERALDQMPRVSAALQPTTATTITRPPSARQPTTTTLTRPRPILPEMR